MTPRWIKITLVISLTINLLLIGWIGGRLTSTAALHVPPHLSWLETVPDGERSDTLDTTLRKKLRQLRSDGQTIHVRMRAQQQEVHQTLQQPSVDPERLRQQLATLRQLSGQSQQAIHDAMVDILPALNVDQRRQVMRMLRGKMRPDLHGPGPRGRHKPPPYEPDQG